MAPSARTSAEKIDSVIDSAIDDQLVVAHRRARRRRRHRAQRPLAGQDVSQATCSSTCAREKDVVAPSAVASLGSAPKAPSMCLHP